jgi:1,2-diacylglycerol 3-alpha-glucosyltransferase
MNILMMTNTYLPHVGGVARSVDTFTRAFREKGHNTLVVAPTFASDNGNGDAADESGVVRLAAIQQFNGSDFSVRLPMTGLLNAEVDAFPAHIVHSHHPFLLGDTALRVAANKHVPVIFTHHTLYEEYTHYVPLDSPTLKQFTIELSTEYANLCDGVIAPSDSISKLIRERGVKVPVEVIPTGIDLDFFGSGNREEIREENDIARGAFVIGHVGRLAAEKNLAYLCRAVCGVLKRNPTSVFLVIGAGPAEEEIRTIAEEHDVESQLRLAGKKTGQALADAYAAMDCFVFSSFSETQGLVIAEAMAAGLPVVALDAPGVREVVRHGRNGFLLDAAAEEAEFASCLRKLKSDADLRKQFRQAARRTAQKFAVEKCADKALAFYEQIRVQTRPQRQAARADSLTSLLTRMEVEWDLIAQKTKAAVTALFSEPVAMKEESETRGLPA